MFMLRKIARISERYAHQNYRRSDLQRCVDQGLIGKQSRGDTGWWYTADFETPVIGAGDSPPDDWEPENRGHPKVSSDYTPEQLGTDAQELGRRYGADTIAGILNAGLDLHFRGGAWEGKIRRLSTRQPSTADKFMWVAAHCKEEFDRLRDAGASEADIAAVYDRENAGE